MRFATVCSGIEAASVAWKPLGWQPVFFSEIDKFPCAVLAHHYPDAPNHGDMTKFKDWPDAAIDVLAGGTPCQSFSNAGLRAGLDDPRGQLMLTFGAIAARYRPRWLVWENVPGVLSSNGGRDFGAFLGLLGFLGYGFAYRVLDAQYVRVDGYARAVPQRRNRVFVVGCLGDWRSAAAVLLEREGLRGDIAPRRSSGARAATCLDGGPASGGDGSQVSRLVAGSLTSGMGRRSAEDPERDLLVAGALAGNGPGAGWRIGPDEAAANQLVAYGGNNTTGPISVSSALSAHGGSGRMDFESETFVAHTLRGTTLVPAIAFNARQDPINGPINGPIDTDGASNGVMVPGRSQVRRLTPRECERLMGFPDDYTLIPTRVRRIAPDGSGPCAKQTVTATVVDDAGRHWIGTNHCMRPQQSCPRAGMETGVGYELCRNVCQQPAHAEVNALKLAGKSAHGATLFIEGHTYACESCQEAAREAGIAEIVFGKPAGNAADGPRYKALGNSWAINCARWVGQRISMVDKIERIAA